LTQTLKKLRRVTPMEFAVEVARMRKILNAHGYDADPLDIEAAWAGASMDKNGQFVLAKYVEPEILFTRLMQGLELFEPQETKPVEEEDDEESEQEQDGGRASEGEADRGSGQGEASRVAPPEKGTGPRSVAEFRAQRGRSKESL
jgi:hypothetical protein